MAIIYEDLNLSFFENATMKKGFINGVHKIYRIIPDEGYVLHVKGRDYTDIDHITGEEIYKLGFTRGSVTCSANYDFVANPDEFYAVIE